MKASNPDLFFLASYPADSAGMLRAIEEQGLDAKLFGGPVIGLQYGTIKSQMAEHLNGIVDYELFVHEPTMNFPGVDAFIAEYQKRAKEAGTDPLGYYVPPLVYATFQVLEQAVKATGSLDDDKLAQYIHANAFNTIVGEIRFNELGEWANARVLMVQFQNIQGSGLDQYLTGHKQVIVSPAQYRDGSLEQPFAK